MVQETGWSAHYPTGEGLFAFADMDGAVAALQAIEADYSRHAAAARAVAERELESGRVGQPRALFAGPYPDNPGWTRPRSYDVSSDGERFLMTKLPADRPRPRINVVLNWFDELRGKVPR